MAPGATLEEALGGGEDYELLIAVSPADLGELLDAFEAAGLRAPSAWASCGPTPRSGPCRGRRLERLGWQHRLG